MKNDINSMINSTTSKDIMSFVFSCNSIKEFLAKNKHNTIKKTYHITMWNNIPIINLQKHIREEKQG
jgi:hypothetical protein